MADETLADRLREAEAQRDAALARIAVLEREARGRESCEGCESEHLPFTPGDDCEYCRRNYFNDHYKKREGAGGNMKCKKCGGEYSGDDCPNCTYEDTCSCGLCDRLTKERDAALARIAVLEREAKERVVCVGCVRGEKRDTSYECKRCPWENEAIKKREGAGET